MKASGLTEGVPQCCLIYTTTKRGCLIINYTEMAIIVCFFLQADPHELPDIKI